MSPMKATSFFAFFAILCGISIAQLSTYQEKCDVGKTSDGRELDTCDTQKFLKCRDSRCQCSNPKDQIWTYSLVKVNSRARRGKGGKSKGGFGKGVATGAIAGAAGGYLAGRVASGGGSSGIGGGSIKKDKYTKYYSCYSRVGGSCMLPNALSGTVLVSVNKPAEAAPIASTTTTTAAPTAVPTDANATTTAQPAAPVAAAQTSQVTYDILSLPNCVEHAVCRAVQVKIVNGTVVSGGSEDPRIGSCQCKDGYKANSQDICIQANGVGRQTEVGFLLTIVSLLVSFVHTHY